jgi:hypothetical protein
MIRPDSLSLPVGDQAEVMAKHAEQEITDLQTRIAAIKAQLADDISDLLQEHSADLRDRAEIYWRCESIPVKILFPEAGNGGWLIAQKYPYWSWTCPECSAEVPVTSRTDLQQLRRRGHNAWDCQQCRWRNTERSAAEWQQEQARRREREHQLRTMPYKEYLQTPEWQERRKAALKRAGHSCQVCNRRRQLHVHHRTYERRGVELNRDLIVLCDECHALYHGKGLLATQRTAA